jgi:uncharacterized protein YcbX
VIVTALSLTPVKGTRLRSVDHVRLEPDGVRENRRFYLIDEGDRLANGKRLGALTTILSDYDDAARHLSLRFPDGRVVEGAITLGDLVQTRFYSHRARGRIVGGPFSAALSEHVGESLRLVEAVEPGGAVDRGADGVASLISRASLARLAEVAPEVQDALLGPAPAYVERVNGIYRWQLHLRAANVQQLLSVVPPHWVVEVDPEDLR